MQSPGFRACESCRALKVRCISADGETGNSGRGESSATGGRSSTPAALPPISERAPCRRCQDTGAICVYTEPRRTKRKRTDVRVRELEREVRMLSELLVLQRRMTEEAEPAAGRAEPTAAASASPAPPPVQPSLAHTPSGLFLSSPPSAEDPETTGSASQHPPSRAPSPAAAAMAHPGLPHPAAAADPVAAGVVSMDKATRLFRRYITVMAPQRPIVVFPNAMVANAEQVTPAVEKAIAVMASLVREHKPVLFLSVLAAAVGSGADEAYGRAGESSGGGDGALAAALDALLLRVYADRIVRQNEKSLELVQSLLLSAVYIFGNPGPACPVGAGSNGHEGTAGPAASFDHVRFYQHLQMATRMAVELESMRDGAGGGAGEDAAGGPGGRGLPADPLALDRTMLACYTCCSSISLGFHVPALLSFTPRLAAYLRRLETSPHAAPTDPVMIACVHLQRIVDAAAGPLRLHVLLHSDNSSSSAMPADASAAATGYEEAPDLADPTIQASLTNATRQMEQWRQDHSRCMTNSLLIQYNSVLCLLHESSLFNEFDPADLKPPYRLAIPSPPAGLPPPAHAPLTPAHLASRRVCLMSARALLGLFLASPTKQLLGSPIVVYARIGYAVLVLLKLQISAALPGGAMNGLLVDTATGSSATQVYHYMGSLLARLEALAARGGRLASVWLSMVRITHAWYEAYFLPAAGGHPARTLQPADADIGPVVEPLRYGVLSSTDAPSQQQNPCPETDPGHAVLVPRLGTSDCAILETIPSREDVSFLSGDFETGGMDWWMDSRIIGLGDI